ncbi:hypothetical protein Gotri_022417 [Gossypium trilobum]|uniref:Myb/SANT-like domain-containing protein n=1 Tax=Gossypium trilobum TaxID=34281 RepID=A0A7J9DFQ1_9ROSI|nr:hypothetical protein [Gossypium trilobum]
MLSGKDNSDLGWDEHRQLVVAKDVVWNSYINAQTTADIIEEIDVEDVTTTNIHEETIFMDAKLMFLWMI